MAGRYRAYPEYKDSGVEWLGEMPTHWLISRLKFFSVINPSKSQIQTMHPDTEVTFLPMEAIGNSGKLDRSQEKKIKDVINGYTFVGEGDVCIAKITPCFENGKGAVATGLKNCLAFATTEVIPLRCNQIKDAQYLYYMLTSSPFNKIAEGSMYGAGGQKRVSDRFVANYHFALPSIVERQQISTFLDHETAKIDTLIEKQQKLIALLKEKRQAVISHAVTKGLNPDAPMKDSGVEWLGEVPAHWEIVPLKYLCTFRGGGTPSKDNPLYWENGNIPWVSPKDMKKFWLSETKDKLTPMGVNESSTNYIQAGSLLMVVRSGILQRTIPIAINTVSLTLNQDMKALNFGSRMKTEYVSFIIQGNVNALLLEWHKEGATVESIEHEYLSNSYFPVPPVKEQETIIKKLNKELRLIDGFKTKVSRALKLLQERRTALISAAVTGKIDVRNWQPPPTHKETQ